MTATPEHAAATESIRAADADDLRDVLQDLAGQLRDEFGELAAAGRDAEVAVAAEMIDRILMGYQKTLRQWRSRRPSRAPIDMARDRIAVEIEREFRRTIPGLRVRHDGMWGYEARVAGELICRGETPAQMRSLLPFSAPGEPGPGSAVPGAGTA